MKKGIHPKYYPNARVVCACGASFTTGSTKPKISVPLCSGCHHPWRGEEKIIKTSQVEKFEQRRKRAES